MNPYGPYAPPPQGPAPGGPGGFTKKPDTSITITLNGTGRNPEIRQSAQVITFRPNDVAIIRVEIPFTGNEFSDREIYTGPMINQTIRFFGRGIYQFSEKGMPSKQDGQYLNTHFQFRLGNTVV